MGKYKICVYGVCKNEEKFAKRCMDSLKNADLVVFGDTGSTDNTVAILRDCGAKVYEIPVKPWRFDVARNACLEKIPEDIDICVCIDLDEVLEDGWREALESVWEKDTNRANYLYIWKFNPDGSPGVWYYHERIHSRHNYRWIYPTHEVLEYLGEGREKWCLAKDLIFKHYPDTNKSRSFNLSLLELAVNENPNNARNINYLGREYYFMGKWDKAIETLEKYLSLKDATWKEERSFALRYIACCYKEKGELDTAKLYLLKAMSEAPNMREPYVEMARLAYLEKDWNLILIMIKLALEIKENTTNHHNEQFAWNETPYNLASLAYYYTGDYNKSLKYALEALKISPNDERIKNNFNIIKNSVNNEFVI